MASSKSTPPPRPRTARHDDGGDDRRSTGGTRDVRVRVRADAGQRPAHRIIVTPAQEGFTAPIGATAVDALIDTAAGTITIDAPTMHLDADLSVFTPLILAAALIIPYGPTN